jgi:hypothetical protein
VAARPIRISAAVGAAPTSASPTIEEMRRLKYLMVTFSIDHPY